MARRMIEVARLGAVSVSADSKGNVRVQADPATMNRLNGWSCNHPDCHGISVASEVFVPGVEWLVKEFGIMPTVDNLRSICKCRRHRPPRKQIASFDVASTLTRLTDPKTVAHFRRVQAERDAEIFSGERWKALRKATGRE